MECAVMPGWRDEADLLLPDSFPIRVLRVAAMCYITIPICHFSLIIIILLHSLVYCSYIKVVQQLFINNKHCFNNGWHGGFVVSIVPLHHQGPGSILTLGLCAWSWHVPTPQPPLPPHPIRAWWVSSRVLQFPPIV